MTPPRERGGQRDSHIAVRDSKTPARATLTFLAHAFTAFIGTLKNPPRRRMPLRTRIDRHAFRPGSWVGEYDT
ncbi:DUF397 domain-containing protein [Streptomyces sp. WAC00469]|nr:DUF397 domain-containing protein [Streptomyces sp. WAC00469]